MSKTRKKQQEDILSKLKDENDLSELEALENLVSDKVEVVETTSPNLSIEKKSSKKPTNIPFIPPSDRFKKKLKQLALDEGSSMQKLIEEGLSYVIEKRGDKFDKWV